MISTDFHIQIIANIYVQGEAEVCPPFQVEVISSASTNDFDVELQNAGGNDPYDALFQSGNAYLVTENDAFIFKLSLAKWDAAVFDLKKICLTTVGIESFRIILKDVDMRNILKENVCILFYSLMVYPFHMLPFKHIV